MPAFSNSKYHLNHARLRAQAQQLVETEWHPIGPDMLLTGYLPAAGGLWGLHQRLCAGDEASQVVLPPLGAPPPQQQQQLGHGEQTAGSARQRAQQEALRRRHKLDRVRCCLCPPGVLATT